MEGVLAQLGVERLAKSQISELCTELDAKAEEFRKRALSEPYPYVWLDALYEKVRIDGAVVSNAVVIAYGVTARGFRDVIAIDVVDTESKESWTTFLRSLRNRGLSGTKLVISNAHEGLKAAVATVMQGASWQRCTCTFTGTSSRTYRRRASLKSRPPCVRSSRTFLSKRPSAQLRTFACSLGRH